MVEKLLLKDCFGSLFLMHPIQHHIQHHIRKYKKSVYQYLFEQLFTTRLILHKKPYTPPSFQKNSALHRRCFQKHPFFTTFYQLSRWIRCAMFQINTNLLIIQQNINIFSQKTLYLCLIWKRIGALHRKRFLKHPFFAIFLLFLKVSEVCNISSKR